MHRQCQHCLAQALVLEPQEVPSLLALQLHLLLPRLVFPLERLLLQLLADSLLALLPLPLDLELPLQVRNLGMLNLTHFTDQFSSSPGSIFGAGAQPTGGYTFGGAAQAPAAGGGAFSFGARMFQSLNFSDFFFKQPQQL